MPDLSANQAMGLLGLPPTTGSQLLGVVSVVAFSVAVTIALVWITRRTVGLRALDEEIDEGLDVSYHGERAYGL